MRIAAIILMALATAFNLMGGLGTGCVALNPAGWSPAMAKLAPYQWLYILLMVIATIAALWGIVVTVALARGKPRAYRNALIVLVISTAAAGVQTFVSQALRGSGAPQNMRFYLTLFVLAFMLLLRLPPIWRYVGGFRRAGPNDLATPAGLAAFAGGLVVLTTPLWASPTHVGPDGANWVNALRIPLLAGGVALAALGLVLVWWNSRRSVDPAAVPRVSRRVTER